LAVTELALGALGLAGIAWAAIAVLTFLLTLVFLAAGVTAAVWKPGLRCRCFGALTDARFGWSAAARSTALATAAGIVAISPSWRSAPVGMSPVTSLLLLTLACVLAAAFAAAATAVQAVKEGVVHR